MEKVGHRVAAARRTVSRGEVDDDVSAAGIADQIAGQVRAIDL
jgi:hypothetical protein